MKKVALLLGVLCISASMFAVDIFTRTTNKKGRLTTTAEAAVDVTAEAMPLPRPTETICPVTGVPIKVTDATPFSVYKGAMYFFLNENSKALFEKDSFKYSKDIETCIVCGKQEKKTRNKTTFISGNYGGVSYKFCNFPHKDEFMADPKKYMRAGNYYAVRVTGKKKKVKYIKEASAASSNKSGLKGAQAEVTEEYEYVEEEEVVTPEVKPAVNQPVKEEKKAEVSVVTAPAVREEKKSEVKDAKPAVAVPVVTKEAEKIVIAPVSKAVVTPAPAANASAAMPKDSKAVVTPAPAANASAAMPKDSKAVVTPAPAANASAPLTKDTKVVVTPAPVVTKEVKPETAPATKESTEEMDVEEEVVVEE